MRSSPSWQREWPLSHRQGCAGRSTGPTRARHEKPGTLFSPCSTMWLATACSRLKSESQCAARVSARSMRKSSPSEEESFPQAGDSNQRITGLPIGNLRVRQFQTVVQVVKASKNAPVGRNGFIALARGFVVLALNASRSCWQDFRKIEKVTLGCFLGIGVVAQPCSTLRIWRHQLGACSGISAPTACTTDRARRETSSGGSLRGPSE